jgi:hypothetical protein
MQIQWVIALLVSEAVLFLTVAWWIAVRVIERLWEEPAVGRGEGPECRGGSSVASGASGVGASVPTIRGAEITRS